MLLFSRPELHAATGRLQQHRRVTRTLQKVRRQLVRAMLMMILTVGTRLCSAQGPVDGALHGIVQDSNLNPIPAANITVHGETGQTRSAATGPTGDFLLPHLSPGSYTVTVNAPGFASFSTARVTISLGETRELEAALRPTGVATTIAVVDESSLEQTAGVNDAISAQQMQVLPATGRRWQDFALTTDGVLPDQDADGLLSTHGLPSTQNSLLLDGADHNQSFSSVAAGTGSDPAPDAADDSDSAELSTGPSQGLSRSRHAGVSYSFSQAAVREFRVSTQNYSAATGNAAGAVVTTVSKSGTQDPHGSGFFILRSQAFAATNPLSLATSYAAGISTTTLVKPHDLRENFGGALGGPLLPSQLKSRPFFYFVAYDQQRRGYPAVSSPANPAFYSLTPIQRALLATRGVKTAAIANALTYLSSLTGLTSRRADQDIVFGRGDWSIAPKQELGLQYNRVRWSSPAGLIDAPVVARGRASLGNSGGSLDSILLRAITTLSPHWINQLRLQYARDVQFEQPQPNLPQEPAIGPGGQAPEVNIGPDGLLFGTPAGLARQAYPDERRMEVGDTITLEHGHHLLELGVQFSAVHDRVATLANGTGTFRYDSTRTTANAGGLVDFITDSTFNVNAYPNGGCPSINAPVHLFCFTSFSQSFGEQRIAFSTQEWAGFVEDTWRPRRGLTLHAGARYEYLKLPTPSAPNAALDQAFGTQATTSAFPEDRNNLGPRFGASWAPFGAGQGVIKLGYGAYFGRLPGATIRNALANTALAASTTRISITPSVETLCPQVAGQGFGYPCAFLAQPTGVVATTTSAMLFARDFRLPTVQQGSISFERAVGRGVNLSAGYVINIDRQLASSTDLNIAPSTAMGTFQIQGGTGAKGVTSGETFLVPLYTARLNSAFGPVTKIVSHVNASYNGLILAASLRGHRSLAARLSYSWSRAIDYGANTSATPRTNGQFDPFANGYDKGLSSLNYPQSLRFIGVWTPHLSTESPIVRHALSGWELAPIVLAHSGRPYSYEIYGGPRLSGGHQSINGSGGALYLPTVGRNTLRLPTSVNTDLRVSRRFTPERKLLGQPMTIRLSAELFNLTNRRNISSVQERAFLVGTATGGVTPLLFQDASAIASEGLNTQPFGTATSASTSLARERQIQLSLHLNF